MLESASVEIVGVRTVGAGWFDDVRGPVVRCLVTVEVANSQIRHVRNYFFSPEVLREVGSELGLPYRVNGYRDWPVSAKSAQI